MPETINASRVKFRFESQKLKLQEPRSLELDMAWYAGSYVFRRTIAGKDNGIFLPNFKLAETRACGPRETLEFRAHHIYSPSLSWYPPSSSLHKELDEDSIIRYSTEFLVTLSIETFFSIRIDS